MSICTVVVVDDSPLTGVKGGPLKIFDLQGGGLRKLKTVLITVC